MTDEIRPALTPEQWAMMMRAPFLDEARESLAESVPDGDERYAGGGWHGLAAIGLYQQPFGFTREDAKVLARFADCQITDSIVDGSVADGDFEKLASLAARIIALLPPAHQETPK